MKKVKINEYHSKIFSGSEEIDVKIEMSKWLKIHKVRGFYDMQYDKQKNKYIGLVIWDNEKV